MNTDHNLWIIIQNGNSKKSLGRDSKGGIIILPRVSFEEHVAVQRETKARTLLLQSLPEDRMADFHHLNDAREFWLAVKARFGENKTEEAEQIYGLMARFESDFTVYAGNAAGGVNHAAAEFAMMGISPKLALEEKVMILSANLENANNTLKYSETLYARAKIEKQEWEIKFVESLARFDKWQESSKNLAKLLYSSMSTRTKLGLGFKEYIRSNELCDLSTPSVFNPEPENKEVKSLYESPKTNDSFSTVDVKLLPKSDVKDPSLTNGLPSCSFKEKVITPRNLCNKSGTAERIPCKNNFARTKKCFVCGSKSHLIKDCNVYDTVDNFPSVVSKAAYVPAGSRNSSASTSASRSIPAASRNRSASIHTGRSIPTASSNRSASIHSGRSIPAASRNKPASIHAGKHIPAGRFNKPAPFPVGSSIPIGWTNPAARPFFGPTNLYFNNVYWPGIYDHMSMNEGRWGSAVKSLVGCSWRNNRPNMQWGSKNNGGSHQSTRSIHLIFSQTVLGHYHCTYPRGRAFRHHCHH
nr:xylulose kinase-1 [Tanacetum cinerariifolium]